MSLETQFRLLISMESLRSYTYLLPFRVGWIRRCKPSYGNECLIVKRDRNVHICLWYEHDLWVMTYELPCPSLPHAESKFDVRDSKFIWLFPLLWKTLLLYGRFIIFKVLLWIRLYTITKTSLQRSDDNIMTSLFISIFL